MTEFIDPPDDGWPNCETPDCENKRCQWSGTVHCFPCAERLLGREELIRRYDATHDRTWAEQDALDAAYERGEIEEPPPNYWNGDTSGGKR